MKRFVAPWLCAWTSACGGSASPAANPTLTVEIARPAHPDAALPPETPQEQPPPLERFAGTFDGTLQAGEFVPVRTEFFFDGTELRGSYVYGGEHGDEGSLYDCEVTPPSDLSCIWSDSYGEGPLTLHFDALGLEFEGAWATDAEPDQSFPWTGRRREDPAHDDD